MIAVLFLVAVLVAVALAVASFRGARGHYARRDAREAAEYRDFGQYHDPTKPKGGRP